MSEQIGQALKIAMAMNRYNSNEAAKACQLTNATITNIAKGRANPTIRVLQRIAEGHNMKLSKFIALGEMEVE